MTPVRAINKNMTCFNSINKKQCLCEKCHHISIVLALARYNGIIFDVINHSYNQ